MQALPIPTDNLYKFFAVFGLVILVTVIIGSILVNSSTNQKLLTYVEKIESIDANGESESKENTKAVYSRLIEIAAADKKHFSWGLGVLGGFGILMVWHGFHRWYKYYQPKHDLILELTIKKLEHELEGFNNQVEV